MGLSVYPGFVNTETCDLLIDLHRSNQEYIHRSAEPFWDERVIYPYSLPDLPRFDVPKAVCRGIQARTLELIEKAHGETFYDETTDIVLWPVGSSMGPHADAENQDGSRHWAHFRHEAATLYLNSGFEGGELYMPGLGVTIEPRPGTLVCFGGGLEYLHGVHENYGPGDRYALSMWFTRAREHASKQR